MHAVEVTRGASTSECNVASYHEMAIIGERKKGSSGFGGAGTYTLPVSAPMNHEYQDKCLSTISERSAAPITSGTSSAVRWPAACRSASRVTLAISAAFSLACRDESSAESWAPRSAVCSAISASQRAKCTDGNSPPDLGQRRQMPVAFQTYPGDMYQSANG